MTYQKKNLYMNNETIPWEFGIKDNFLSVLSPCIAVISQIRGVFCPRLCSLPASKEIAYIC